MISRRNVARALVNLVEAGKTAQQIADILAAYLLETAETRSADLYLRDFRAELARRTGLVSVEAISAHQLTKNLETEIKDFITKQTGAKQVEILSQIQPNLVSGVVISTTDSEYNGSLSNQISKLRAI